VTKTLQQLYVEATTDAASTVAKMVAAAFWAGQSDMRGKITKAAAERLDKLPTGRYRRLQRAAARFVLAVPGINGNALNHAPGADAGDSEAAEIMGWEFDIDTVAARAVN